MLEGDGKEEMVMVQITVGVEAEEEVEEVVEVMMEEVAWERGGTGSCRGCGTSDKDCGEFRDSRGDGRLWRWLRRRRWRGRSGMGSFACGQMYLIL